MTEIPNLQKVYDELFVLFDNVRTLLYAIGKYNPGIESEELQPLPTLAHTMRNLGDNLKSLGIDTLAAHDERQMKDHIEGKE